MSNLRRQTIVAFALVALLVSALSIALLWVNDVKSDDRAAWREAMRQTMWLDAVLPASQRSANVAPCTDSMTLGRLEWTSPLLDTSDPRIADASQQLAQAGWRPLTGQASPRDFSRTFQGRHAVLSLVSSGEKPIGGIVATLTMEPRAWWC